MSGYSVSMSSSVIELDRENPLFDEAIPIALHSSDVSSFASQTFTLRILSGYRSYGSNQNEKLLHLEVTLDSDPYFLFVMDVGEQDFHLLKKDQSIVVEFPVFASKLIELLNLCLESCNNSNPSNSNSSTSSSSSIFRNSSTFSAKLDTSTGQFSISETNPFKQIIHISLLLRAGNDASIKAYLASRLKHALKVGKTNYDTMTNLQEQFAHEVSEKKGLIAEITDIKTSRDVEIRELKTANAQEIANLQLLHYEAMEETRRSFEVQNSSARSLFETTKKNLGDAIADLERTVTELQGDKSQQNFQLRELNRNLDSLKAEHDRLNTDFAEVTRQKRETEELRQKAEKENYSLLAKLEAIQIHVKDKEEAVNRTVALHNASQSQCRALEDRIKMLEETIDCLQERIANGATEIGKGNNIILRFQSENKALKEKLAMKTQVIRKQEAVLNEVQARSSELEGKYNNLRTDHLTMTQDKLNLQRQLEETKEIVKKNEEMLESNKKVIAFLNEEQNKWQLGWISGQNLSTPSGKAFSGSGSKYSGKFNSHSPDSIIGSDFTDMSSSTISGSGNGGSSGSNQDWRTWDVSASATVAIGSHRDLNSATDRDDMTDVYRKGLENLGLGDVLSKDATYRATLPTSYRSSGVRGGATSKSNTVGGQGLADFSLESIDYFSTKPNATFSNKVPAS